MDERARYEHDIATVSLVRLDCHCDALQEQSNLVMHKSGWYIKALPGYRQCHLERLQEVLIGYFTADFEAWNGLSSDYISLFEWSVTTA